MPYYSDLMNIFHGCIGVAPKEIKKSDSKYYIQIRPSSNKPCNMYTNMI